MTKPLINVVSPVYKSEKIVAQLVQELQSALSTITENYEIILVCDGSPDNSWQEIKQRCSIDKRIIGIKLSRNFGQHKALSAGLKYANGEYVVVIDCDLQDNPAEIIRMYEKAKEGYDIVFTRRIHRKDSWIKRLSSKIFYTIYQCLSGIKFDGTMPNYGMYSHKVVATFNQMKDEARSFQSLISYLGYSSTVMEIEHNRRYEGKSSYSLLKLLKLSEDVILANSNRPLRIGIAIGFFMTIISILFILYNLYLRFVESVVPGFSATIISIWFVGGVIVTMLGIIGLYIDRIFKQVKARPLYIVDEIVNRSDDE